MRPSTAFRSFFMGGFECSTHRLPSGRRLDVIGATAHDRLAGQDYARLASVGIRTARDGVRWHLIERSPGVYDFTSIVPMLEAAREHDVEIIWDLMHYGWPDDIDPFSSAFIHRFADFARAFVELATAETQTEVWIVPVNEISFFSWAAGDAGLFNPFARRRGDELKVQLVRAAIAAIEAARDVNAHVRIVHTDPLINIVAHPDRPHEAGAAEHHRQAQYAAFDMIAGRTMPELGGREEHLGVLGLNYYIHNQWVYPGGHGSTLDLSHRQYRPVWQMIREVYERYRRPLFIAETGIEDEARPAWLRYIGQDVRRAIREGVPVQGLCLYPIVNHPGWDDDRHCYNGLWDYPDAQNGRAIYEPLARELVEQQRLLETEADAAPIDADAELLDLAAHWMEIRSRREDIFQEPEK